MGPKNACSYADLAMDKIDLKAKFSGPIITCDQAYFFWERRREKGEGKKIRLIHLLNEMPTAP